ncbi:MAG TPA: putative LPS assembly protein LptD [Ferruginibacter sp.]|nr:LPS-assembly protein LptD [Bacteroidota bacterium]HMT95226.1 putative LPS assembly protein LptD [Ferruginibacter sp.]HMU23534.1 putative LPS assembly protein LptD [Ferruginibacter sp.]
MRYCYKVKVKNKLTGLRGLLFLLVLTQSSTLYAENANDFHSCLTYALQQEPRILQQDTTIKNKKNNKPDSGMLASVDTFNFKMSKDSLTAPVVYHADDSMVMDVPGKKLLLYGKTSSVKYTDMQLSAPLIAYDQKTSLVKAHLTKDSLGTVVSFPAFVQGDSKMVSDTIVFNMKTGKGLTKGTYTQQGEMYVYGEKIKRVDENVFYALKGRFTTCNLDTPHFAFISKKIKFINKKWAFSGPVHPEFEGVPVPVVLPFGIYPLNAGRHSGLLAPTFTTNDQYGVGLENLGYYHVFGDYWDLETRASIFSYGGHRFTVRPRYLKLYRFAGNFEFNYLNTKVLDMPAAKSFNVRWSHRIDNKARPGVTFSASVNAGSSKYNSNVPNSPIQNYQSLMASSINYSKVWKNKPFNISLSANHDQNTASRLINLNMPTVNFNMNTIYPFRREEPIGPYKWYENLGIGLNTMANSKTFFYEDTTKKASKQIAENLQWGAVHSVPISLSLPSLGPLQLTPSVSYREQWYQQKLLRKWNPDKKRLDTLMLKEGFFTERDISFSAGASTRIFGMFTFSKKSKVQAIRHEIRPTIGFSYKPDINKNHYQYLQYDTAGHKNYYGQYANNLYPGFARGKSGSINFGIDNNISMKVRNKKDTSADAVKKIVLIDGFNISGSYNLLVDSFKMSNLSISARSNLFEKIQITASASMDPYLIDPSTGRRMDKLVWSKRPFSLGRMTTGGISLQSSFNGGNKKSGNDEEASTPKKRGVKLVDDFGNAMNDYEAEAEYMRNNPGEFVDYDIPWDISIGYSLRYSNFLNTNGSFTKSLNQDVNINASMNLTPKWKLGANGSFNITTKEIGMVSMYLSRDMHCWQMSVNISPVGRFRFFSINISPKSPILRDLKVNRTRSFMEL